MYRNRSLLSLVTAALLAFPAAQAGAQDKPVTPKTVGTSVERESKRAANRTGDVVQKAGKQTEAQAKRAAKSVKKVYSRKERRAARGELTTTTSNGTVTMVPGAPVSKPLTPATVGTSVERESKRAANRTGDVVQKAGKQTEAQAKRAAKSVKKIYSREARRDGKQ